MSKGKIMVVDDEREIAELIRDYLVEDDYDVVISTDGHECIERFREYEPDLLVLDVMLPGLDGLEICRIVRAESSVPIIMLSARTSETDKVVGLELGADDYVAKPFSPREVVARVKAMLRRVRRLSAAASRLDEVLSYGELDIHTKAYTVTVDGEPVALTTKQFEVLRCLAVHPNQVLSRRQIYEFVWGEHEYGDLNTVTVHIKKIREQIEKDPSAPRFIQTVRGVGYKFWGGP